MFTTNTLKNCFCRMTGCRLRRCLRVCMWLCLSYVCLCCLTSCNNRRKTVTRTGICFDTVVTITLYDGNDAILDKCFALCDHYEKLFSKTIPDSDIARINHNATAGKYTTVSEDTVKLLQDAGHYYELCGGRFDITIGRLTDLWDYKEKKCPTKEQIEACLDQIGFSKLEINGQEVRIKDSEAALDVGGIAKGYIADRLKEFLLENGVKKAMINLGGNILLIGSKPDGGLFHIGIQKPFSEEGQTIAVVGTSDSSVVTSGVYERYFYEGDVLIHHILDTRTGYPVRNDLLAVTILSKTSVDGDGLSTGVFAMGLTEGMALVERLPDIEAVFIDRNEQLHLTSGLKQTGDLIVLKE